MIRADEERGLLPSLPFFIFKSSSSALGCFSTVWIQCSESVHFTEDRNLPLVYQLIRSNLLIVGDRILIARCPRHLSISPSPLSPQLLHHITSVPEEVDGGGTWHREIEAMKRRLLYFGTLWPQPDASAGGEFPSTVFLCHLSGMKMSFVCSTGLESYRSANHPAHEAFSREVQSHLCFTLS